MEKYKYITKLIAILTFMVGALLGAIAFKQSGINPALFILCSHSSWCFTLFAIAANNRVSQTIAVIAAALAQALAWYFLTY